MIYAKVDVDLRDNRKARSAGEAMATWTYGLLYSRGQELDGFVDREALRGGWVDEKTALKHAAALVLVGLWEVVDGGWQIANFSNKNDTKQVIDARKEADRVRKAEKRAARALSGRSPLGHSSDSNGSPLGIPGTGTGTGTGTDLSRERDPEPTSTPREAGPVHVADPNAPAPSWWPMTLATIGTSTAVDLPAAESWLRYAGHRSVKRMPPERGDAIQWLTAVMVKEAREAREKARRENDRDASFKAKYAPAPGLVEHQSIRPPTVAEAKALAERIAKRAAERNSKGAA